MRATIEIKDNDKKYLLKQINILGVPEASACSRIFTSSKPALVSWYYILDGNSEYVAQTRRKIGLFGEETKQFVSALDLIKCLER